MDLSNEKQLLIECARTRLKSSNENKIKELAYKGIDWELVVSLSIEEKILPLVYHNITKLSLTHKIPDDVLTTFNRMNYGNLGQNIAIYDELKKFLKLFKISGIDAIVLKGAAYVETIYDKNISLRSIGDIDFLVKNQDLLAVKKLLLDCGYAQKDGWYEYPQIDFHHLVPFFNPEKKIAIEVHWTISMYEQIFNINMDQVWNRAYFHQLDDNKMWLLSVEDMIIHQILHLFMVHHGTILLKNLCDLSETIRSFETKIDWYLIIDSCERYNIGCLLFAGLFFANNIFQIGIQEELFLKIENKCSPERIQKIKAILINTITILNSNKNKNALERINWVFNPTNKFKLLKLSLFPSADLLIKRYTLEKYSRLKYFYYFARPLQLLFKMFK